MMKYNMKLENLKRKNKGCSSNFTQHIICKIISNWIQKITTDKIQAAN